MIKIFNDLKNELEEFKPIKEGVVTMYVCGVTVYDDPHLGHARSAVSFDLIRKYFEYKGYRVKYVMNYTDVDDKMISRANERGITIYQLAQENIAKYEEMQRGLFIKSPTVKPRATDEIPDMIKVIKKLEKKGFTYGSKGSVYFDTSKMENYKGLFMKKEISDQETEEDQYTQSEFAEDKKNLEDFVLWKKEKPGEPSWDSPWGKGRPGWHIECSVMAMKYLGKTVDIHGGGKDLKRPHHQNEIAQSESSTGKTFVNYWMHNGFLNIDNTKMSKSLGNFISLMDMLKNHSGVFLRYYLVNSYYQRPINFSMDKMDQSLQNLKKIQRFYKKLNDYSTANAEGSTIKGILEHRNQIKQFKKQFLDAMDTDFNSPKAMGYLFSIINYLNKSIFIKDNQITLEMKEDLIAFLDGIDSFLGFINPQIKEEQDESGSIWKERFDKLTNSILDFRKEAKINKNFELADQIRDLLINTGIKISDQGNDYTWEVD
ncbi:cysteine--tRNA ligase [Promethearchaeum syntrophicum]|uniref:Cysteine--tRNA ligase n=1 Tax=Promethearchaeum syntrophicum TaxID=2594042 RepID=A0A5B9D8A7_9ARCH|nr:cysteine--tRNA ligase [Candidatus Prometheoarchaeum syntrophicum]QEE15241.1 cysteinyl-tRNA synthetase [Candidatus Prometheoarchaeum syntrophicum]